MSEAVIGSRLRICFTAKTGAPSFDIPNLGTSKTQELSEDISLAILIRVYAGTTINTTLKIMFNAGDAALPYEPYTGGAPSPSPDYPQEIELAGDYNEETKKYEYEIRVTGKNILSIPDITPSTPERTIACNIARDITISAQEVPVSISSNIWRIRVKYLDGTLSYFADVDFLSLKPKTFHASAENPIIAITYRETYITEGRYGGIQVEYGTSATEYQPFTEQTITLTSDRPLTEWDRLERRDGVWGWVYESKEIVLDGSENWRISANHFWVRIQGIDNGGTTVGKGYSTHYFYSSNVADDLSIWIGRGGYSDSLWIHDSRFSNAEELSEWLAYKHDSGDSVLILAHSPEETFTPLQDSEQAALNALHSNYPTTVLSNEYRCDMSMIYKTRKSLEVSE